MKVSTHLRRGSVALAVLGLVLLAAVPAAGDPGADLSVTKSDSPDPVVASANITYDIVVSNAGPDAATDVTLSDTIPVATTFMSLTAPGDWMCTTPDVGGTGQLSCDIASFDASGSAAFALVVRVDDGTADGTVISNTATVSSADDPDPLNDAASTETTVGITAEDCTVIGSNKSDILKGTDGNDVICGFQGKDTIDGLGGDDIIFGGQGKDSIDAGDGADFVKAGNAKDQVVGGPGPDVLLGGNGRDTLNAEDEAGGDELDGGRGKDTCLMDEGDTAEACP